MDGIFPHSVCLSLSPLEPDILGTNQRTSLIIFTNDSPAFGHVNCLSNISLGFTYYTSIQLRIYLASRICGLEFKKTTRGLREICPPVLSEYLKLRELLTICDRARCPVPMQKRDFYSQKLFGF